MTVAFRSAKVRRVTAFLMLLRLTAWTSPRVFHCSLPVVHAVKRKDFVFLTLGLGKRFKECSEFASNDPLGFAYRS